MKKHLQGLKFEPTDNENKINKPNLGSKISKLESQISYLGKYYNDFILQYNKQSIEEILVQRAVKTTIQIYDMIKDCLINILMPIQIWKIF